MAKIVQHRAHENEPLGLDNLLIYPRHGIKNAVGAAHVNKHGSAGP